MTVPPSAETQRGDCAAEQIMDLLKELQRTELGMLKQLDQVCRTYNIPYFVIWGTALGTKRHQGFIPWDDDIDIGMLRSDYERLKKVPADEWNGLTLIDAESDCFFHEVTFPRLYKPGTILDTEYWIKYYKNPNGVHKPIWLDIFLYDYVNSPKEAKKKAKKAHFLHIWHRRAKYRMNVVKSDPLKRRLIFLGRNFLHDIFVIPGSQRAIKCFYRMTRKDRGKYLISYDNGSHRVMMKSFLSADCIFPTVDLPFEDMLVKAPADIDAMLKRFYGDYMVLPPEEKRFAHLPHTVRL